MFHGLGGITRLDPCSEYRDALRLTSIFPGNISEIALISTSVLSKIIFLFMCHVMRKRPSSFNFCETPNASCYPT